MREGPKYCDRCGEAMPAGVTGYGCPRCAHERAVLDLYLRVAEHSRPTPDPLEPQDPEVEADEALMALGRVLRDREGKPTRGNRRWYDPRSGRG